MSALLLFNTLWLSKSLIGYLPTQPLLRQERRREQYQYIKKASVSRFHDLPADNSASEALKIAHRASLTMGEIWSDKVRLSLILIAIVTPEMYNQKVSFFYNLMYIITFQLPIF